MSLSKARGKRSLAKGICLIVFAASALFSVEAQPQDARYTEYGFSFQPPTGWVEDKGVEGDIRVRYLGPQRQDRTRSVLYLIVQDQPIGLSNNDIESLVTELAESFKAEGMEGAQVTDRRRVSVAGLNALQVELAYKQEKTPMRLRQVYVPVSEHRRTYLFTFIDTAQQFDKSAAAADSAINSFAPAGARAAGNSLPAAEDNGAGSYMLLLTVLGFMGLLIVVGATYLLLRKRPLTE